MLYKLVGSGMEEKLSMFVLMDSPSGEYRSRESPAGVVVEVLICSVVGDEMIFMSGSGRRRNYILCGKKGKPTGLYFCVIME